MEMQTKLENLYKYRFPFKLEYEDNFTNIGGKDDFIIQTYKIKNININSESSFQFCIEQTLAFIKYLQSELITKKKEFYKMSKYYINAKTSVFTINLIEYEYIRGELNVKYNYINKYEKKRYFEISLDVAHYYYSYYNYYNYYNPEEKINTYLEKSYKIKNCVIYLDNKPDIIYMPCLHFCVCFQCDDIKFLKDCPYCRERIKNRIIRKI